MIIGNYQIKVYLGILKPKVFMSEISNTVGLKWKTVKEDLSSLIIYIKTFLLDLHSSCHSDLLVHSIPKANNET